MKFGLFKLLLFSFLFIARCDEISDALEIFLPASAGSMEARVQLSLLGAKQIIPHLANLNQQLGRGKPLIGSAMEFCGKNFLPQAAALGNLFNHYGSDKAAYDFHYFYGRIIDQVVVTKILEVGLGTNKTDIVSTMGASARPGASLRAFRDYLPRAHIYGADFDSRILFSEPRITTFQVDQTIPATLDALGKTIGELDIIIDDGLHAPSANLAVLTFAVKFLRKRGWCVIEDIPAVALPLWEVVNHMLKPSFHSRLIQVKHFYVFIAQKL